MNIQPENVQPANVQPAVAPAVDTCGQPGDQHAHRAPIGCAVAVGPPSGCPTDERLRLDRLRLDRQRFTFVVEATERDGVPPIVAVRRWLKLGLRQFGLRCTEGRELPTQGREPIETTATVAGRNLVTVRGAPGPILGGESEKRRTRIE